MAQNVGLQLLLQSLQAATASLQRSNEAQQALIERQRDYELRKQQLEEQNTMRNEYHKLMDNQLTLRSEELDFKKEKEQRYLFMAKLKAYGGVREMVRKESTQIERDVLREVSSQEKWKSIGSFETLADITKRRAQVEARRDLVAARQGDKLRPEDVLMLSFMKREGMQVPEFQQRVRQDPAIYDDYLTRLADFENEAKPQVTRAINARRDSVYKQTQEAGFSMDFSFGDADATPVPEELSSYVREQADVATKDQDDANIDPDNEISLLKAAVAKPGGEEYRDLLQRIQTGLANGQSMSNIGVALTEMRKKLAAEDSSEGAQVLWDAFVSRLSDDLQAMSAESPE